MHYKSTNIHSIFVEDLPFNDLFTADSLAMQVGLPRQEDRAELVRIKMEGTPMDSGVDL